MHSNQPPQAPVQPNADPEFQRLMMQREKQKATMKQAVQ